MITASVGFQCPQCVREGAAPPVRTAAGGVVRQGRPGVLTRAIIAVCVVAFVLEAAFNPAVIARFSMLPPAIADGQYYRLVTAAFLHESLLHIALNMWALWIVGPVVEQAFGRLRFSVIFVAALLGGSVASYVFGSALTASVGASGAIFGLFGALAVVHRKAGVSLRPIAILIGLNLVLSFTVPGIDWHAHIGGLVVGTAVAAAYALPPPRLRTPIVLAVLATFALAGVLGVALRTASLRSEYALQGIPLTTIERQVPPVSLTF